MQRFYLFFQSFYMELTSVQILAQGTPIIILFFIAINAEPHLVPDWFMKKVRVEYVLAILPLTSSCRSHSCCSKWQYLRSAGEPGHVEVGRTDGVMMGKRDSRAVTVTMKMSVPECQDWGRHRDVSGYASLQVRQIYS